MEWIKAERSHNLDRSFRIFIKFRVSPLDSSTHIHFVDTCTIAVGPATGTVVPITCNNVNINALYDTGASMSCMSLETFDSLKLNLTKERFPLVVTATGTSMDPIGFTQCTFLINGVPSRKNLLFALIKLDLSF